MSGEGKRLSKDELKEDQFLEWLVQAAEYVRDRAQLFVAGAVGLLAIIVISFLIANAQEQAKIDAAIQLGEIWLAEEEGRSGDALRLTEDLVREYEGTIAAGQGVIILANRYYSQGRFAEALEHYHRYLSEYGDQDVFMLAAWNGIAACLEAQGRAIEAATKYTEYATSINPGSIQASTSLFEAARCYGEAGDTETQRKTLEQIVADYAQSPIAARAREELSML